MTVANASIKQARGVIDHGAFDGEHLQLGRNPAVGGEAAGLVAGREHALDVARLAGSRVDLVDLAFDEFIGSIVFVGRTPFWTTRGVRISAGCTSGYFSGRW